MKYFNGLIIFSVLAILFPLNGNSNGLKDRTEYQYLDSIVYCASKNEQLENRTKLFFEYDEFNRLASCIGYQWEESTFEWENHSKRNYTYNEIGRNIRVDEFTWNVEVENWLFKNRKDSLISSTGNLEEVVEYLWDTSENKFLEISHIWFNGNEQDTLFISGTLKKINRYNGDNLQYSSSYRKDTPDVWNLISKIEYEYDDSNLLTTEKLFTRTESDSLELQEKTLYEYSSAGELLKNEFFKKNSTTGSLELRKSYLHEFNDETERILELEYHEGNTSANLEYSRKKELIKTLMGDTLYYENSALANVGMLIYERDIVEYDERGNLLLYVELKNPSGYRVFSSTRIRDAYEYDEADRVINEKSFTYDVYGASFSPLTEKDIIYSINGKDSIEIIYQNWNEENQNWINMYKTDFFYNDEGYDTLILKSRIDIVLMPDWIYTYKIRSFVDSEGNDTLKQDYRWENDLQSWILTQENKYMYDEKNNIILTLQKNNENNSWDTVFRNEYIYNNVGEIIQKDEYNTTRKISSFYYDEYVLTLQYKWNNSEADWELEFQKEYYSDGSYKDLQYVNDSTKILSSNFFGYNSDGDLIRKETYSARDINENLYNMSPGGSQIWNFTYPNIENKEKTIMPRVKEMTFSNFFSPSPHFYYAKSQEYKKIASFDCLYPSSTVGWYINHKRIMYFSELKATQISVDSSLNMENQEISLKVYPNPAKDNVFIDMPKNIKDYRVIITSILGNEIMNVFNKSNIAIENLEPGQYLLSVESKDKIIYTQKLVIK